MSIFRKKKNLNKFKNYFKILIKLILKNPLTFYLHIFNFFRDYKNIKKDIINTNFDIYPTHPYLFDKNDKNLKLEYFHFQDLWAFKTLSKNSIVELVDIGSNLSFIAFASSVSKIKCIDIRPHKIILENVDFAIGNITNLPFENESINNISSLSVIEHIGLGRYGDEIDLFGMEKSAMEFTRVLKKNGNLIISFPFGKKNIIEFNAHRICNFEYINQLFKNYNIKNETFIFKSKYNSRDEFKQSGEPDCIACFHFVKK